MDVHAIMFMEHRTEYMKVYPMKNKSAESVIAAVEKLRVWVASLGDGCKLEELRGDFNSSLSVSNRGEHSVNEKFTAYLAVHSMRLLRSSAYTQRRTMRRKSA